MSPGLRFEGSTQALIWQLTHGRRKLRVLAGPQDPLAHHSPVRHFPTNVYGSLLFGLSVCDCLSSLHVCLSLSGCLCLSVRLCLPASVSLCVCVCACVCVGVRGWGGLTFIPISSLGLPENPLDRPGQIDFASQRIWYISQPRSSLLPLMVYRVAEESSN